MDPLTCAFCNHLFVDPLKLDCLHTFCKKCIEHGMAHTERETVKCSLCSGDTLTSDIQENRLVTLAIQAKKRGPSTVNRDENTINGVETLANDLKADLLATPDPETDVCRRKLELKDTITKFYSTLISDVTIYLKEQSTDILGELDKVFEKYELESCVKNERKKRLVQEIESMSKLFNSVYTERTEHVMSDILREIMTYFRRCRDILDKIGIIQCDVSFLSGNEQKDLVLSTNFGALVDQTTNEQRNLTEESNSTNQLTENETEGDLSFGRQSDDVINGATLTPQLALPRNSNEELTDQSLPIVERVGYSDRAHISTNSDNHRSTPEAGQSVLNDMNTMTISPGYNQLANSTPRDMDEEEPPPPYWMAVGENEALGLLSPLSRDQENREVNSRRSPRLSGSFSSSRSSTGPESRARLRSFNLHNQDTVHASNPLQYATHALSIRTHLPDDVKTGPIVGIAWLRDKLVLVDRFNSKIKLFLETGKFLHSLKFADAEPWDVCSMNTIEVMNNPLTCAVPIPRQKLVMLIQVVGGRTMLIGHRIATRKGYVCIAYDQKNAALLCGVSSPFGTSGIDIINTAGVLLRQFALPPQVLVRSIDVSIKDAIIICDWRKNNVVFLSTNGTLIGQYGGSDQCPLLEPVGTCTDGRGFLLVADSKSNSIHILNTKGMLYGTMKSSCPIIRPKEINVRPDGPPKLALSHGSMFVEVFNLFESDETSPSVIPSAPAPPPPTS
ncbi:uncharacterized protein LOC125660354 [Ostrea edulis]|uniref:uncharacterized protein LOC125660354 n=1 Tax=Ostrea edulis TaxID=37623 RepID=UPI0024AE9373|nr:uncharacterized protein LOC125660354 [Ostrea edulis]